jgi:hypothetical protein
MRPRLAIALAAAGALCALTPASASAITIFSARPIDAVEGEEVRDEVVTEFADDGACAPGDYSATIAWGDGSSAGTVNARTAVGGQCIYAVIGSHTYARAGSYPLSATVTGTGDTGTAAPAAATIREAEVGGQALSFGAGAGVQRAGRVARIDDANRLSGPGDFTASIDWGDGAASAGTVSGQEGRFVVDGAHAYATPGTYRLVVTVAHGGRRIVLDPATVTVGPGAPAPALQGSGLTPSAVGPRLSLSVLGSPLRVASVRRRGLRLRLRRGRSTARTATLELRRGTRLLQRARVRLGARGSTVTFRWRPSRRVARRLRAGRYSVHLRIAGAPRLQASFRLRR